MVAADFLSQLSKLHVATYIGVEDFADKLNFLYTFMVLICCFGIVTVKTYVLTPLHCYMPQQMPPTFINYVDNYCWAEGTYAVPLRDFETENARHKYADKKITYYQWVPFMLGIMAIMFYIPRVFWTVISYNRTGTDLQHLISQAGDAVHADREKREKIVSHIVRTMETLLFYHRELKRGPIADFRRKINKYLSFFIPSKRFGTWLVFTYFFVKCLYLANSVGQLHLMAKFLGFDKRNSSYFGIEVAKNLVSNKDWQDTMVFPRVGCCSVPARTMGAINDVYGQCVLPVNMLNEKIFVFLWFWIVFVAIMNALSIPLWFARIVSHRNRSSMIKKFLKVSETYRSENKDSVATFTNQFLRHDGIFLIRMISMNAGDIVTCDIVTQLWERYREKYLGRDLRKVHYPMPGNEYILDSKPSDDDSTAMMLPMSQTGKGRARKGASAPHLPKQPMPTSV